MMIRDGKFFCDLCEKQIDFAEKQVAQVIVEFVKGGSDRHYCEDCILSHILPQANASKRPA
jgi:hypothetical protein